jgi:hypothetical protein
VPQAGRSCVQFPLGPLGFSSCIMALVLTQPLNIYEYQGLSLGSEGGQCIGQTTLPPSCANNLEFLGASISWTPKGLSRPAVEYFY